MQRRPLSRLAMWRVVEAEGRRAVIIDAANKAGRQ